MSDPTQSVLITGASSGIGLELARLFSRDKYRLVLTARSADALEKLADEFRKSDGVQVDVIAVDLATDRGVTDLVTELDRRQITIDILVNNAGFGTHGKFWENPSADELGLLQLNIVSLVDLTHRLLPGMVKRGHGRILNVASTAAFQPGPLMANYYASKAYVLSFSLALGAELRGSGVSVTALCPGPTTTNFQNRAGIANSRLSEIAGLSARQVAQAGYTGLMRGRDQVIPGWKNRLLVRLVPFVPRAWVSRVINHLNKSR